MSEIMSMSDRCEIVSGLYRMQAEIGVLLQRCQAAHAEQTAVFVEAAQAKINEAIQDTKPDSFSAR